MASAFLTYLTVFKSRLALMNLILPEAGPVHQTTDSLNRKLKRRINQQVSLQLSESANADVFQYLQDKTLLSATPRNSGRYKGISLKCDEATWTASGRSGDLKEIDVFSVDVWMSDSHLRSTIGAPTDENTSEIIEMAQQLGFLTKTTNTLTGNGNLFNLLRNEGRNFSEVVDNPFVLTVEEILLLRQIVDSDLFILREVVREILSLQPTFSRDEVAKRFDSIVWRAVESAKQFVRAPSERQELIKFAKQVDRTMAKYGSQSGGPGLLEHRVSPRLEWLTDLGYLSKDGLPKNGFNYQTQPALLSLLGVLDAATELRRFGSVVAISEWSTNPIFAGFRATLGNRTIENSIGDGYTLLRRPIGPVPIQDLAFIACLYAEEETSFDDMIIAIETLAKNRPGIAISGGRSSRLAENIFIPDSVIEEL